MSVKCASIRELGLMGGVHRGTQPLVLEQPHKGTPSDRDHLRFGRPQLGTPNAGTALRSHHQSGLTGGTYHSRMALEIKNKHV